MNQTATGSIKMSLQDEDALPGTILRESHICPVCGCNSEIRFVKKGFPIRDCIDCGHRFAGIAVEEDHVERVYADSYFHGSAGEYPDYLAEREILISHGERYARILDRYMEPGTILDVGAAGGFILKGFEERGWQGQGLEPNATMANHARQHLGIPVETGTIEQTQINGQYDLISMIQVVAHFVDPRRAFAAANELTEPGGYWLIESWDRVSRIAKILGKGWHEYNPPSVLHWFSIESLGEFVESFGMQEIARGRPPKWISPLHAKSIAKGALGDSALAGLITQGLKAIPQRLALPYMLDDIFWILYQKPI